MAERYRGFEIQETISQQNPGAIQPGYRVYVVTNPRDGKELGTYLSLQMARSMIDLQPDSDHSGQGLSG